MIGDSFQIGSLSELMSRQQTQQRLISQNIANVNTPGWKTIEANFDQTLDQVMTQKGMPQANGSYQVTQTAGLMTREDGNNVDIDRELGKMDKASLLFQSYSQILSGKLSMLRIAVGGR